MDPIPVLSQCKSLVLVIFRRREQARQTQINFSRQCPIISQARSAVEAIKGDQAAARETQKECGRFLGGVVNSVPVIGHISGAIHYIFGDKDGGDLAMKAASHTTAVMAGGIGGFFIAGPVGAIGLGIGAGVAIDSAITGIDTGVHWKKERKVRTFGITEPFSDPKDPGKWFDAACGVALDGATAYSAGKLALRIRMKSGVRGSPETAGTIRPSMSSMTVFMKVVDGTLYFMQEKAKEIGPGYVIKKCKEDCFEVLRVARHEIVVWIKNKKVHIKDAGRVDQVIENGHYTVNHTTGKVEDIQDKEILDNIESIYLNNYGCIEESEKESNNASSINPKQERSYESSIEENEEERSDDSSIEETEDECSDESSIEETKVGTKRLRRQKGTSEEMHCRNTRKIWK